MMHVEHVTPIVKLNLKLHCSIQVYAIIMMDTYLLKELSQ